MIESMEEYELERYEPLEQELLERTAGQLGQQSASVQSACLAGWREALAEAVRVQQASALPLPCAYMSLSLLNTSLLPGSRPLFQIDFYDAGGAYGWPWARTRMAADFLFQQWDTFTAAALDETYFVRSRVPASGIRALFWETADRLMYLFTCFAKYFAADAAGLPEYAALLRSSSFFITSGMYLDWQEQIYGERPAIDLFDRAADEDTRFRQFTGTVFRGRTFSGMELTQCRFRDCLFADCRFEDTKLLDASFQNCRFHRTVFQSVEIAGCLWRDCSLRGCELEAVRSVPPEDTDEYYAEAELRGCYLENVHIRHSDLSGCRLRESQTHRLVLEETDTGGPDTLWVTGPREGLGGGLDG